SAGKIASAASANPLGSLAVLLGLAILGWANRDEIRGALGFGRSNGVWVRQIREWTLEKRKWELVQAERDRDSLHIVFRVPTNEQQARNVNVIRSKGSEEIAVTVGLSTSAAD